MKRRALPVLMWLAGMLLGHSAMLLSGLGRVQGDLGDARFVGYILEHTYRWLTGWAAHASLWDPPFFYPARNVLAYSETFLGTVFFYWPWRLLQIPADTSFQLWLLTASTLNYWMAYVAFRRVLSGTSRMSAAAGALLFAFGASRINQVNHPQLLLHFLTPLALLAVVGLIDRTAAPARRVAWLACLMLAVVGQLYTSVYLGWFMLLGFGLVLVASLFVSGWRRTLVSSLRSLPPLPVAGVLIASLVVLAPLALHYRAAAAEVSLRGADEIAPFLPRIGSWLSPGPRSWLYGNTVGASSLLDAHPERWLGIGPLTTLVCIWGLWLGRRRPVVALLAGAGAGAILLSTQLPGIGSPWWLVYKTVPAAGAIRVVARIGVCLLLPAGVGLAVAVERVRGGRWSLLAIPLVVACAVEQGVGSVSYGKADNRAGIARIAGRIDPGCDAFFYSRLDGERPPWKHHVDAMWAQIETGVPTINGYSGNSPPGWNLWHVVIRDDVGRRALDQGLAEWRAQRGLDMDNICRIEAHHRDRDDAVFLDVRLPEQVRAGEEVNISLLLRNTGSENWTREEMVRLGSQDPQDGMTWGLSRAELPAAVVPAGATAHFQLRLRAPDTPGLYTCRWRMLREGVYWFGALSEPKPVRVVP